MNPMVHCQLWMGNLEPNMTESFIMAAFQKMGENPQSVKVMRNKYTGEPAGYCFVHFASDDVAVDAMHKLNGKPIPGTNPVVRFRLNNAGRENRGTGGGEEREFSIWVGDLSSDVDDYSLYRVFSQKYNSIKTAKVILDNAGFSKGYGFVRFGSEDEQKHALWAMNGYSGLGSKLLKICTAAPKSKAPTNSQSGQYTPMPTQDYSQHTSQQYYDPSTYWQNYSAAWSGYYGATGSDAPTTGTESTEHTTQAQVTTAQSQQDYSMALIEHKVPLDVDALNKQNIEQERNLWDGLDSSRWLPTDVMEVY